MKRFTLLLTLLLLSAAFIVALPGQVQASSESSGITYGKPIMRYDHSTVKFVLNDAYESGMWPYDYQYAASVWNNYNNQRVTVAFTWGENGTMPALPCCTGIDTDQISARMIQYNFWVNKSVQPDEVHTTMTKWHKYYAQNWDSQLDSTYYFSFLESSTKFKPGTFEIEIGANFTQDILGIKHTWWETIGTIYGEFTYGSMKGEAHQPDPANASDNVTWYKMQIAYGEYDAQFYYLGPEGSGWNVSGGVVKANGKVIQPLKDYGTFTRDSTNTTLYYTFDSSAPTGIYAWVIKSINADGTATLFSWSDIIHNSPATLNATGGKIPEMKITLSGEKIINHKLTITVQMIDSPSQTNSVWLFVYYSSVPCMMPDPSTPLMQLFQYPMRISVGNSSSVTIPLLFDGIINVKAIAKDDNYGSLNQTVVSVAIQGFDTPGGAGTPNAGNPWIMLPWNSTLNLILLGAGVILIFSRKPTLQAIGIALFFASFINWGHVGAYLSNSVHNALFGWVPHLQLWGRWK